MTPKRIWAGIITSIVVLEVLSVATTDFTWPWSVLSHDSLLLRILGWYLVAQTGFGFLALVFVKFMVGDRECPICYKDLNTFIPVYGEPVICRRCGTWFHKNCLRAKNNRCPICFPEDEEGPRIDLDFTSDYPH
jgi:hypothetical protein